LLFENTHLSFGNRFYGDRVPVNTLQSENITGEIKASNLPAPIFQELAGANCAANDFVKARGESVLVNDFAFGRV
jgi:hypothetical protein